MALEEDEKEEAKASAETLPTRVNGIISLVAVKWKINYSETRRSKQESEN